MTDLPDHVRAAILTLVEECPPECLVAFAQALRDQKAGASGGASLSFNGGNGAREWKLDRTLSEKHLTRNVRRA